MLHQEIFYQIVLYLTNYTCNKLSGSDSSYRVMLNGISFLPHTDLLSALVVTEAPNAQDESVPDPPTATSSTSSQVRKLTTQQVWSLYLGRISHCLNTGLVLPNKSSVGSFLGGSDGGDSDVLKQDLV